MQARTLLADRERKQASFDVITKTGPHDLQKITDILALLQQHGSPIRVEVIDSSPDHFRAAQAFLNALSHVAVQIVYRHIDEATVYVSCVSQVIEAVDALKLFIDRETKGKATPATKLAEAWRAQKSLRTGRRMIFAKKLRRVISFLEPPKPGPG